MPSPHEGGGGTSELLYTAWRDGRTKRKKLHLAYLMMTVNRSKVFIPRLFHNSRLSHRLMILQRQTHFLDTHSQIKLKQSEISHYIGCHSNWDALSQSATCLPQLRDGLRLRETSQG